MVDTKYSSYLARMLLPLRQSNLTALASQSIDEAYSTASKRRSEGQPADAADGNTVDEKKNARGTDSANQITTKQ